MNKKEITFRDPVVERVVDSFIDRSNFGFKKYGKTLHDERTQDAKGLFKYINDVPFVQCLSFPSTTSFSKFIENDLEYKFIENINVINRDKNNFIFILFVVIF